MQKAVFLDRDGVIIRERGDYNFKPQHVEVVDGIVESMKILKKEGFLFIVISNQGGIAKKRYAHKDVGQVHKLIKEFLSDHGLKISSFFYCPHHDTIGKCLCRKPDSLMLERAIYKHNIDPAKSFFIGDKQSDMEAGEKAGVRSFKIESNQSIEHLIPEMTQV